MRVYTLSILMYVIRHVCSRPTALANTMGKIARTQKTVHGPSTDMNINPIVHIVAKKIAATAAAAAVVVLVATAAAAAAAAATLETTTKAAATVLQYIIPRGT